MPVPIRHDYWGFPTSSGPGGLPADGYYRISVSSPLTGFQGTTPLEVHVRVWIYDLDKVYSGDEQNDTFTLITDVELSRPGSPESANYWYVDIPIIWNASTQAVAFLEFYDETATVHFTVGGVLWSGDEFSAVYAPPSLWEGALDGSNLTVFYATNGDQDFEFFNPDNIPYSFGLDPDYMEPDSEQWLVWGDDTQQTISDIDAGEPMYHTYESPGTYTVEHWVGWWNNSEPGSGPPTVDGLHVRTKLAEFEITVSLMPAPTNTQPRTHWTGGIVDATARNLEVTDWPNGATRYFGYDCLLVVGQFSVLRNANVSPDANQVKNLTFHQPFVRYDDGSGRGSSTPYISGLLGVEDDIVMHRWMGSGTVTQPTAIGGTAISDDAVKLPNGNGDVPVWRKTGSENFFGTSNVNFFYLHGYRPSDRRGLFSGFNSGNVGFAKAYVQPYNIDTGELVGPTITSPHLPDDELGPLDVPGNSVLPDSMEMYGGDRIVWQSRNNGLWVVDHDTDEKWLHSNFLTALYGPDMGVRFGSSYTYRFSNAGPVDVGASNVLLQLREDGGAVWLFTGRDADAGDVVGYAWYAITVDRGGRVMGSPRRVSNTSGFGGSALPPWLPGHPSGEDWGDWYTSDEHGIVADPIDPVVYMVTFGEPASLGSSQIQQGCLYRVDLITGTYSKAAWLGHPARLKGRVDGITAEPIPPATYSSQTWDYRWLDWIGGATGSNIGDGTYKLRGAVTPEVPNITDDPGSVDVHYNSPKR